MSNTIAHEFTMCHNTPMQTPLTAQIRTRAADAGISIPALLRLAGVGNSNLWRWENRGLAPSPVAVKKIMDALEVAEAARRKRLAEMEEKMQSL